MNVTERFLNYVAIESTSYAPKEDRCSDDKILNMTKLLLKELQSMNPDEISVNQYGIIDCKFRGKGDKSSLVLCSHMDTSSQASDKDVKVRIEVYEGKDIPLNDHMVLSSRDFPSLKREVGHHIIHTDGTTLLGGDDKAGIAIIMTALSQLQEENIDHRPLEIIFTTDEEIGVDAEHVSMELVTSPYGYTVDGGAYDYVNIETFTAYSMKANVIGKSIHPGSAKDKMVNASNVLIHFQNALPEYLRPEDTDKKEPFYHLCDIHGSEESAKGDYIIRSFDENQALALVELAKLTARRINDQLGYEAIRLDIQSQYHNMKQELDKHPDIQKEIEDVYSKLGYPLQYESVRGGTTGSQLSFMGLPCPNLGTGDYNCHGPYEYVDQEEMEKMVEVVKELMKA